MGNQISSRFIKVAFLLLDALILVICFFHIPSIIQRGQYPFSVSEKGFQVVLSEIYSDSSVGDFSIGDTLLSIDGSLPRNVFELQFLADTKNKNDSSMVIVERNGKKFQSSIPLNPFYPSMRFILLTFFVSAIMLILSGLMIFSIPHEPLIRYLHTIFVSLSATLMLTWGTVDDSVFSVVATTLFFISYSLFGLIFFLFCYALWKPASPMSNRLAIGLYSIVLLYAGWTSYLYVASASTVSLELFRIFFQNNFFL